MKDLFSTLAILAVFIIIIFGVFTTATFMASYKHPITSSIELAGE